jgi:hydrogenase large subunit
VKVHTIIGGKNPHPNFLVGGVPCAINIDGNGAAGAPINMERLNFIQARINEMIDFCKNVYIPDVLAIGTLYKHAGWLHGGGLSATNVLDYGEFPKVNYDQVTDQLPGGAIMDGNWDEMHPVDPRDPEQVQEFVTHSWYKYADETKGLHPWDGVTEPNYKPEGPNFKGTRTRIEQLDESAKYSWIKAPRWRGHAMEVGPLSRYILAYAHASQGNKYAQRRRSSSSSRHRWSTAPSPRRWACPKPVHPQAVAAQHHRPHAGTLPGGQYCAEMMVEDFKELVANIKAGDSATATWRSGTRPPGPRKPRAWAAPPHRAACLAHWIKIKDGKIDNYQCVVPTTWNGSPRDAKGPDWRVRGQR